jgi:hypothetical protein
MVTRGQGGYNSKGDRKPGFMQGALSRAVIAMTAVRIGAHVEPGKVTDPFDIRPPTDVMAITSLPMPEPIIRSPVSR